MKLGSSLIALGDGTLPSSFEGLKSHVPLEWIELVLSQGGVATVRRRKLPADQVVWLVIGLALYRDRPMEEVIHRLDLVLPEKTGERGHVTKGAIPQARERLGEEPMHRLFETTARPWALESAERYRWHGLRVFGGDGSTLRVPDSLENRDTFGLPGCAGRSAGYPQLRVVAIMALGSHVLWDAAMGDFGTSEQTLMWPLLPQIPDHSVTILDRAFMDYGMLYQLSHQGPDHHWLIRARRRLKWRRIKRLGRGDYLVEVRLRYKTRREHPEWPHTFLAREVSYQRKGFPPAMLLTSLLDPKQYPASEIIELYHQRWELEMGYDEIKTHTLERLETLRSQSPEAIRQEVWGLLMAYNLVRREMEAVALQAGISPQRISFRTALVLVRDLFFWAATAAPGSLPKMIQHMRLDMSQLVLPPRRDRRYPRQVKMVWVHYARNNGHPGLSSTHVLN